MAISVLGGLSTGFFYATHRNKELEIKQGKNYYLSAFPQAGQIGSALLILQELAPTLQWTGKAFSVCTNVFPIAALAGLIVAASTKHGHYETLAKTVNLKLPSLLQLPEELSPRVTRALQFCSEHAGDFIRLAMVVGTVALVVFGSVHFAAAMIAMMVYQALDNRGLIPFRISLFMERYLPIISSFGLIFMGSLITQLMGVIYIASFFPGVSQFMLEKLDAGVQDYFKLDTPLLKEIYAPVVENKQMTFSQIEEVLKDSSSNYEINPAHCSKPAIDVEMGGYETSFHFNRLKDLFSKVDWEKQHELILPKLLDDDRFCSERLQKKNPKISLDSKKTEKMRCLNELVKEKGGTHAQFVAEWLKTEMEALVDALTLRKLPDGTRADLEDARNNCSYILPYLQKLDPTRDRIEMEDVLLRLAIEGGGYCARGIKSVSSALLSRYLIQKLVEKKKGELSKDLASDPLKLYELQLRMSLQKIREELVQGTYEKMMAELGIPAALKSDVHAMDIYRIVLSQGVAPLTSNERFEFGMDKFPVWKTYQAQGVHKYLYEQYEKILAIRPWISDLRDTAIKRTGSEEQFIAYLKGTFAANPNLTKQEKGKLNQMLLAGSNENWRRLAFVMLGVLREKAPAAAQRIVPQPIDFYRDPANPNEWNLRGMFA